jgi:hypothetical protein
MAPKLAGNSSVENKEKKRKNSGTAGVSVSSKKRRQQQQPQQALGLESSARKRADGSTKKTTKKDQAPKCVAGAHAEPSTTNAAGAAVGSKHQIDDLFGKIHKERSKRVEDKKVNN